MLNTFRTHFRKLQQSIIGGAFILGIASLLSRVLGLLRDRLLASEFNVGPTLDSYFHAFKVPDFLFNLLVLGVMSASFVPIFIEQRNQKGEKAAYELANNILNILVVTLVGLAVVCAVFAPQIVNIIAWGDNKAESVEQTVLFMRLMLLALVFFGFSNVFAGMLHAQKRFAIYAVAPLLYNIGIIFGIIVLVPVIGVIGLPIGVVIGAACHACIQLPFVLRDGFRYRFTLSLKDEAVRRILRQAPPRSLALGLAQLNTIILFGVASTLPEGSRSVLQFADNLQNFPINIFGVSLALAVFPVFSEALADNNKTAFTKAFSESFRRILFFIVPVSIMTLLLRAQIVRVVYGAGQFDWNATLAVAQMLGAFSLSMFAQSLIPLLARSYFAKQDTKTPVVISIVSVALNTALALLLAPHYGMLGIGMAYSIAAIAQMMLLLCVLRLRHGDLDDNHIINSTWKIVVASFVMGVVAQGLKYGIAPIVDMTTWVGVFLQTAAVSIGAGLVYIEVARWFAFEEAELISNRIRSIWSTILKSFDRR